MSTILRVAFCMGVVGAVLMPCARAEVTEHPVIRPYPGAVWLKDSSEHKAFSEHEFTCHDKVLNQEVKKTVKGRYWQLYYEMRDSDGNRDESVSAVEFLENYKTAAVEKGGSIEHEDAWNGFLTFSLPLEDGGRTWCQVEASDGLCGLWIVDEREFEQKITFTAAEMKTAIEKDGRVSVHGILFDVDKAFLKPESASPLQEILRLMLQNPGLMIEIQGHTDDQGPDEHNLALSGKRAETALNYLLLFGIPGDRLAAKGYGESMPVVPNDSEENRARNRRVDLVKR